MTFERNFIWNWLKYFLMWRNPEKNSILDIFSGKYWKMKLSQNLTIVTPLLIICTPSIRKKRKFTEQTDVGNVSKNRKLMSDGFEKPSMKMKINCVLPKNIVAKNLIVMVMVILEFDVYIL